VREDIIARTKHKDMYFFGFFGFLLFLFFCFFVVFVFCFFGEK